MHTKTDVEQHQQEVQAKIVKLEQEKEEAKQQFLSTLTDLFVGKKITGIKIYYDKIDLEMEDGMSFCVEMTFTNSHENPILAVNDISLTTYKNVWD